MNKSAKKVLIIGSGGREHALAWQIARSDKVETVYVAPGNAGTNLEPGVVNVDIAADDIAGLLDFARENLIGLTIVGPEAPLVAGVVDQFNAAGLACFGPTAAAAQLEGSKSFAKDFMARHNIPRPRPTVTSPGLMKLSRLFNNMAPPSWLKPTDWLQAKASSLLKPSLRPKMR